MICKEKQRYVNKKKSKKKRLQNAKKMKMVMDIEKYMIVAHCYHHITLNKYNNIRIEHKTAMEQSFIPTTAMVFESNKVYINMNQNM